MREFEIIEQIFAPLTGAGGPAFGLRNDTARWAAPAGENVILTKDMMVEDHHFRAACDAGLIARKLLRINLSDLAASGATPKGYLLGIGLPASTGENWLRAFRDGLAADQEEFGVELWGGDTVAAPCLLLSLTAIGTVPEGTALSRFGAKPGDGIYVSGVIGEAALGLKCQEGKLPAGEQFVDRLNLPQPRLALGQALRDIASAAVDISDGLMADVGHLAAASEVGAVIEGALIPLSTEAAQLVETGTVDWESLITGGEDYELAFAMGPENESSIDELIVATGVDLTRIGEIKGEPGVSLLDEGGRAIELQRTGFQHFDLSMFGESIRV